MYKSIFIWKENKMNKDRKWAILTVCHQMMQPMQSVYDWSNCCSFSQTDNMKVISNRVLLHLYYAEVEVNYIVFFCSSLVPFVVRQTHRSILRHAWQVFTIYQRISHTSAKKPPGIILAVFQIGEKNWSNCYLRRYTLPVDLTVSRMYVKNVIISWNGKENRSFSTPQCHKYG